MSERENIERMQVIIAELKQITQEEIKRAKAGGNPQNINAWCKAFHKTGVYHTKMTDLLLRYYPEFGEIVTKGPGGR